MNDNARTIPKPLSNPDDTVPSRQVLPFNASFARSHFGAIRKIAAN